MLYQSRRRSNLVNNLLNSLSPREIPNQGGQCTRMKVLNVSLKISHITHTCMIVQSILSRVFVPDLDS